MSWPKTIFLAVAVVVAGWLANPFWQLPLPEKAIVGDLGDRLPHPFRPPRPPKPDPEPPPAPLDDSDARLFGRLRLHIEKAADDRAGRRIEAFSTELADRLDKMQDDGTLVVGDGEPSQFIGTSFLAGAIFAVVKKIVIAIVKLILVAALVGLFYTYWPIIVSVFVGAVTLVAGPTGWAAGKLTAKKE